MNVRVKSGKHYRSENGQTVRYVEGDVFDATEAELQGFKDRFEIIEPATIDPGSEIPGNAENLVFAAATIDSEQALDSVPMDLPAEAPVSALNAVLISDELTAPLIAAGIDTLEKLGEIASDPAALAKVKGIGKARAKQIREALMAAKIPWAKGGPVAPGTAYIIGDGSPETFVPDAKAEE